MKSLKQILREEIAYWFVVLDGTNNTLLKRTANKNIYKRRMQLKGLN